MLRSDVTRYLNITSKQLKSYQWQFAIFPKTHYYSGTEFFYLRDVETLRDEITLRQNKKEAKRIKKQLVSDDEIRTHFQEMIDRYCY